MTEISVTHRVGRHCASTGIRDMMNHYGIAWSEAMCFGIGAGLGIWYIDMPGGSPSRLMHTRSADVEEQFFRRIGLDFSWEQHQDPTVSERMLIHRLDQGRPALLRTDIYHLPYYNTNTHFPAHVIMVWGYDRQKNLFQVTDTERTEPIEVAFADMRRARYAHGGFFDMAGNLFAPGHIEIPDNLPDVIRDAVMVQSRTLLDESLNFQGVAGLGKWERELDQWKNFPDRQWTARFTYQLIEKRGTGGGGFRLMYADFLREAGEYIPAVAESGLADRMHAVGLAWRDLAYALKRVSENEKPEFREVAAGLEKVEKLEGAYHREVIGLLEN
ncbi:MAG: BtrH N-terminal domain-containing protein [Deltaproteobacteria bacterium]|nr:BtrH N-terminal domain-containing protein [Deltaproteobacteria bacterium]